MYITLVMTIQCVYFQYDNVYKIILISAIMVFNRVMPRFVLPGLVSVAWISICQYLGSQC